MLAGCIGDHCRFKRSLVPKVSTTSETILNYCREEAAMNFPEFDQSGTDVRVAPPETLPRPNTRSWCWPNTHCCGRVPGSWSLLQVFCYWSWLLFQVFCYWSWSLFQVYLLLELVAVSSLSVYGAGRCFKFICYWSWSLFQVYLLLELVAVSSLSVRHGACTLRWPDVRGFRRLFPILSIWLLFN